MTHGCDPFQSLAWNQSLGGILAWNPAQSPLQSLAWDVAQSLAWDPVQSPVYSPVQSITSVGSSPITSMGFSLIISIGSSPITSMGSSPIPSMGSSPIPSVGSSPITSKLVGLHFFSRARSPSFGFDVVQHHGFLDAASQHQVTRLLLGVWQ